MNKILVIDDELDICLILQRYLTKHGFEVAIANTGKDGLASIKKTRFDLIISDYRLPDFDGLSLLKEIKKERPQVKVIIITGYSDIRMAVEVIKYGAVDYITKPLYPEELLNLIRETLDGAEQSENLEVQKAPRAKSNAPKSGETPYIIGSNAASKKVYKNIQLVAPTPISVIITGETGTGKEYVAREIHRLSNRSNGPFVAIDCGALPENIAGSEFFGHEKGAFTGAVQTKDGKFVHANGGTIFLDEIGNLSYEIQVKLLRVLQERRFTRIGGDKELEVDVRVITATNENLKDAIKNGQFREDLFFRLNEFNITLPALRQRTNEIEDFAAEFIEKANIQLEKDVKGIDPEALDKLMAYPWPGNLRELKNVMKRAVLVCNNSLIDCQSLPDEIVHFNMMTSSISSSTSPLKAASEEAEREQILTVLSQTGYNKSKTAHLLNIDRKTLYNKLKHFGI